MMATATAMATGVGIRPPIGNMGSVACDNEVQGFGPLAGSDGFGGDDNG
jgi:hypothetical protein